LSRFQEFFQIFSVPDGESGQSCGPGSAGRPGRDRGELDSLPDALKADILAKVRLAIGD